MKFKKLNINECLFSANTNSYAERLNFECDDGIVRNGAFSKYCIGISFSLIYENNYRTIKKEECLFVNKNEDAKRRNNYRWLGYKTLIYDIGVDSIENNVVYSFYVVGSINNTGVYGKKYFEEKILRKIRLQS